MKKALFTLLGAALTTGVTAAPTQAAPAEDEKKPGELQLVGGYSVGDGPFFADNPQTYTCKQACAKLFGGSEKMYTCSVTVDAPTGEAYVDGWADPSSAPRPSATASS